MKEIWKPIKGFENLYEISNFGNVKSHDRIVRQRHKSGRMIDHIYKGKLLRPQNTHHGYMVIDLHRSGVTRRVLIHRLVGEHFLRKPKGKNYINHLDNNPSNNRVDNLEWCTQSENVKYAYDNGTKIPPHQRRVIQCDLKGISLKIWVSETEAERQLGIPQANIYKVCSGKRQTAGGYKWKYAD